MTRERNGTVRSRTDTEKEHSRLVHGSLVVMTWQIAEVDRLHVERIRLVGCLYLDIEDKHTFLYITAQIIVCINFLCIICVNFGRMQLGVLQGSRTDSTTIARRSDRRLILRCLAVRLLAGARVTLTPTHTTSSSAAASENDSLQAK